MIETERLVLRGWKARDLAPFAALNGDPEVMRHFPATLTRAESDAMLGRLRDRWTGDGICFGVAERKADGAFVGMVGLSHVRLDALPGPCVEIGWRLARPHWGQGYATEAARGWLDYGFATMDLPEIVAIAVPENAPSLAVMRRLGMTRDPTRDFEHPTLPEGHRLRPHLLCAIDRPTWRGRRAGHFALPPGRARRHGRAMPRARTTPHRPPADPIDRTGLRPNFWKRFPLESLPPNEWEALCDGCAKCCLVKLEDDETGEVAYTNIACRLLDHASCRCGNYPLRRQLVAGCVTLGRDNLERVLEWMPATCAYKLVHEGRDLEPWHPLISGDPDSVHRAGISLKGQMVAEFDVAEDDWPDFILEEPV